MARTPAGADEWRAPPSWVEATWSYPNAVLVGAALPGRAVADWLSAGAITIEDRDFRLPQLNGSVVWERRQSRSPAAYEALDWPVVEAALAYWTGQAQPQEHLVSATDAPSFVSLYAAAASLFGFRRETGDSLHQGFMYRHQDTRGRISLVRILDTEVVVEVEGKAVAGMTVELAGDMPGPRTQVATGAAGAPSVIRFALENGLPAGAWVLLRHQDEWIDRRFLTGPWTRREHGVEFVELGTRLEAFLAGREGPEVEFKVQVPAADAARANVMKTVCAFANGTGGSVLFGIDDDRNLVGLAEAGVDRLRDQLTNLVGAWVQPRPAIAFEALPIAGTDLVVLELRVESDGRLHGCGTKTPLMIHVRHAATTVSASLSEIEAMVHARMPPSRASWPFGST